MRLSKLFKLMVSFILLAAGSFQWTGQLQAKPSGERINATFNYYIDPGKKCSSVKHRLEHGARIDAIQKVLGMSVVANTIVRDEIYYSSYSKTKSEGKVFLYNARISKKNDLCHIEAQAVVKPLKREAISKYNSYAIRLNFPRDRIRIDSDKTYPLSERRFDQLKQDFNDKVSSRFNKSAFQKKDLKHARWILEFKPMVNIQIHSLNTLIPRITYHYELLDSFSGKVEEEGDSKVKTPGRRKDLDLTILDMFNAIADDAEWHTRVIMRLKDLTGIEGKQKLIQLEITSLPHHEAFKALINELSQAGFVNTLLPDASVFGREKSQIFFKTDLPTPFLVDDIQQKLGKALKLISYSDLHLQMKYRR